MTRARIVANLLCALPLVMALVMALAGCKSAPPPPPPSGQLLLELSPGLASVLVDDRPLLRKPGGSALRVPLPVGAHRIEIYAPGFFHAYREIDVRQATETRVQVALRPDPDVVP